jgi:hypothetical protein
MIQLLNEKQMNKKISHLRGVRDAVHDHAKEIGRIAEGRLAPHRKTGSARIEVSRGTVDSFVSLVDEAALSIEFGHYLGSESRGLDRHFVRGLHLFIDWYHDGIF